MRNISVGCVTHHAHIRVRMRHILRACNVNCVDAHHICVTHHAHHTRARAATDGTLRISFNAFCALHGRILSLYALWGAYFHTKKDSCIMEILEQIDSLVWGPAMILLLLGSHLYLTIRTRFYSAQTSERYSYVAY